MNGAQEVLQNRGIQGIRILQGFLQIALNHSHQSLESACRSASSYEIYKLKPLKRLLEQKKKQTEFEFIKEDPLIRPLSEYQEYMFVSLKKP